MVSSLSVVLLVSPPDIVVLVSPLATVVLVSLVVLSDESTLSNCCSNDSESLQSGPVHSGSHKQVPLTGEHTP